MNFKQQLEYLRNQIVQAVQEEYNAWQGEPGIADKVAARIASLVGAIPSATGQVVYSSAGPEALAQMDNEGYLVRVDPGLYMSGDGQKIPDVTFSGNDVTLLETDPNPYSESLMGVHSHLKKALRVLREQVIPSWTSNTRKTWKP